MEMETKMQTVEGYIKQLSKTINLIEKTLRQIDFSQSDIKNTAELLDITKIYTIAVRGYISEKPNEFSVPDTKPLFTKISDGTSQILKYTKDMEADLNTQGMGGIHFSWATAIDFAQQLQTLISDIDAILPELIQ